MKKGDQMGVAEVMTIIIVDEQQHDDVLGRRCC
jgi:hypothetical protein